MHKSHINRKRSARALALEALAAEPMGDYQLKVMTWMLVGLVLALGALVIACSGNLS